MGIILATTLCALLLFVAAAAGRVVDSIRHARAKLTVPDIEEGLNAEPSRTYTPTGRGQ
ncbi:hypothetical protein GPX89_07805 [Nocardia sp. ET3-3]|uniref:Uncharacterized protein n=1 Tax=Nocardia terrae TaxID=2675851 RepID=A0A7K1US20_9NOCA|nr:hypothetical protein [Nocardia terrae]MVU77152.1 hypothetical protein [Nocardia terrae]